MRAPRWTPVVVATAGALLWAGAVAAAENGLPPQEAWANGTRIVAGELCAIDAFGPDSAKVAAAVTAALDEMAATEEMLSFTHRQSQVVGFNSMITRTFLGTPTFYAVVDSALAIARLTNGAYDPTVAPITSLWANLRGATAPTDSALDDATVRVGWRLLEINPYGWLMRFGGEGGGMDLSGIVRGAVLDRARSVLADSGATSARILFGSQMELFSAVTWEVPLIDSASGEPIVSLTIARGALATSFDPPATVYDPATGRPAGGNARVAVLAASGIRADGVCDALLVMGRERARAFAKAHPRIGVIWLESAASQKGWVWNLAPSYRDPKIQWVE